MLCVAVRVLVVQAARYTYLHRLIPDGRRHGSGFDPVYKVPRNEKASKAGKRSGGSGGAEANEDEWSDDDVDGSEAEEDKAEPGEVVPEKKRRFSLADVAKRLPSFKKKSEDVAPPAAQQAQPRQSLWQRAKGAAPPVAGRGGGSCTNRRRRRNENYQYWYNG